MQKLKALDIKKMIVSFTHRLVIFFTLDFVPFPSGKIFHNNHNIHNMVEFIITYITFMVWFSYLPLNLRYKSIITWHYLWQCYCLSMYESRCQFKQFIVVKGAADISQRLEHLLDYHNLEYN